ncbi:MAG: ABC transporter substrate-binding protein [Acetobacteraceae bacterium]
MRRRSFGLAVLAVFLAAPLAQGAEADPAQAAAFVKQAGLDLATVVSGAKSQADKEARLAVYMERVVDQDGVARFCLGRYWQVATPQQRADYLRLFRKVLLHGVVNRLGDYQAGSVQVIVSKPVEKPDGTYVPTTVDRPGNKPVDITWMVTAAADGLRIADVVAEGISLRQTQRSDYASFLSRNGGDVAVLIAALKKQVGE